MSKQYFLQMMLFSVYEEIYNLILQNSYLIKLSVCAKFEPLDY